MAAKVARASLMMVVPMVEIIAVLMAIVAGCVIGAWFLYKLIDLLP